MGEREREGGRGRGGKGREKGEKSSLLVGRESTEPFSWEGGSLPSP